MVQSRQNSHTSVHGNFKSCLPPDQYGVRKSGKVDKTHTLSTYFKLNITYDFLSELMFFYIQALDLNGNARS